MANIYAHLPPTRLHSAQRISPSSALQLLSTYISASASDASLQPHSILTESGPISSTSGSGAGLTIHNLKRVEAGLKGEQLGEDTTFAKYGGEGLPELNGVEMQAEGERERKGERKRRRSERNEVLMGEEREEWVSREEFEEQRGEDENVEEADVGERVQGFTEGKEAERMRRVVETGAGGEKADKEARKKAKKERGKAEKKEREKKRHADKED